MSAVHRIHWWPTAAWRGRLQERGAGAGGTIRYKAIEDLGQWNGPVENVADVHEWLGSMGFQRIGWVGSLPEPEETAVDVDGGSVYRGPDARLGRLEEGSVSEVWIDDSHTVLALPAEWVDGTWITFLSWLTDGTVVDTRRRPSRPPYTAYGEHLDTIEARSALHALLLRGHPGERPTPHPVAPPDDLRVQLVTTSEPGEVLRQHRAALHDARAIRTLDDAVTLEQERFDRSLSRIEEEEEAVQRQANMIGTVAWMSGGFAALFLTAVAWPGGIVLGAIVVSVGIWLWPAVEAMIIAMARLWVARMFRRASRAGYAGEWPEVQAK